MTILEAQAIAVQRRKEVKEFRKKTIKQMHERGCSNTRIAEELGVGVRTVQKLKREAYEEVSSLQD